MKNKINEDQEQITEIVNGLVALFDSCHRTKLPSDTESCYLLSKLEEIFKPSSLPLLETIESVTNSRYKYFGLFGIDFMFGDFKIFENKPTKFVSIMYRPHNSTIDYQIDHQGNDRVQYEL